MGRKKKIIKPLTYGYLPINLKSDSFKNLVDGTGYKERILLFYKAVFSMYNADVSEEKDYTAYIKIHSTLVEKLLSERDAPTIVKFMVDRDLIDMVECYYDADNPANSTTRKFRIPQQYLQFDLFGKNKYYRKVALHNKKAFNCELAYKREKLKFMNKSNDSIVTKLLEVHKDLYLDLASPAAKKLVKDNQLFIQNEYQVSYYRYLKMVNDRDLYWYKRDKFSGRLHNAWVTLKKVSHTLLRFKGFDDEYLGEVDIVNSQPYFSSIISEEVIGRMIPEESALVTGIDFNTTDWKEYKALCLNGTIYETWVAALQKFFGIDWMQVIEANEEINKKLKNEVDYRTITPRNLAKKLFYLPLFGSQNCVVSECFDNRFPDVSEAFKTIKGRYCKANPSDKNKAGVGSYTNVSWLMQKLESTVMINRCVSILLDSGLKIIPRHDSIMCPTSQLPVVEQEMKEAFDYYKLPLPKFNTTIKI
jgi:hypothetical protein